MPAIKDIFNIYHGKIDYLDLELLVASAIKKPREFVLTHPEYKIPATLSPKLKALINRRMKHEPIAYILGQKEFYGLSFKIDKSTLIPRPETELMVEQAIILLRSMLRNKLRNTTVIDVGTGSGNIIISIARELDKSALASAHHKLIAIDIYPDALKIARQNAKLHKFDKKIKFLKGSMLEPILKFKNYKLKTKNLIIVANLPYLSKTIYSSTSHDIKRYEPRSALLSGNNGLSHYEKLLKQMQKILQVASCKLRVTGFFEISPEQKNGLQKMIKKYFPDAKTSFTKDLSDRWRLCRIDLP